MIAHIVWDVDPNIFEGFKFLRWYSVSWAIGMIIGYQIMARIYKAEGITGEELETLATYVLFGAIIGARLGHILFYDPIHYFHNPIEILPFKLSPKFQFTGLAGLASHGGILGSLLALYLYHRKFKRDYLWMLDSLIVGGVILGGWIRLGNLMNSEIIGKPTDLPWAFVFVRIDQIARHPAQLYEAVFYLMLGFILFLMRKSRKFKKQGLLFGLGITAIFIQRFLIEFLKENQVPFEDQLMLNMGQMLSIPMVVLGVVVMIWGWRNNRSTRLE